ncbi:O-fucosyltransferase family protein [Abeliophyllum distichum]|uniref:O-fucosyltransferase family protein n=1 Tax=Abeliophyllum distichum TaxID=126358 RepID=A0ABD1NRF4_9LAMI
MSFWGDESEFSDIFELDHFKNVLANDVRIVSSLPSTHLMMRQMEEKTTLFMLLPNGFAYATTNENSTYEVSTELITKTLKLLLRRDGIFLLRGLDSRLSKDLPSDLQKLCCKVAFHALRFAPHISELGNKLTERKRSKGPYLALHLRMEKDVWVRTGCLPGLSREYDEMINNERMSRPKLLTSRNNMTYHDRKLTGLCPLNALEVTRLLKALGAPKSTRIYWAGGSPMGRKEALLPLTREFPQSYNKEDLAGRA